MISVEHLYKNFGKLPVLQDVNLTIDKGDVVCIIGPSGSGKSTFLRCLNLLEKPQKGKIIFEGEDLMNPKIDLNRHRQKMGMVFQQFNLFPHKTVRQNITLAPVLLGKMTQEQIRRKRLTGLHQRIRRAEEKCGASVRTVRKQQRGGVREAEKGNFLRGQQG